MIHLQYASFDPLLGEPPVPLEQQVMVIYAGTRGFADQIPLDQMRRWETDLIRFMETSHPEIGREIALLAARMERDPKEVAEQLASAGRLSLVAADIIRRKALDHLVAAVKVKGRPADSEEAGDEASPA